MKNKILALFIDNISGVYPQHMLHLFAEQAAKGNLLPLVNGLIDILENINKSTPEYAKEMLERIGKIKGVGIPQYETIISILAEIYVTGGFHALADKNGSKILFFHEPAFNNKKNPEFEVCISGHWFAVEVKAPQLIKHQQSRSKSTQQVNVRFERDITETILDHPTLPRDNPVKDFLISAEEKFAAYEIYRSGAYRVLVIVWDDFCNEPIAALKSPVSGLLTKHSFYKDSANNPVIYPHIDGIIIIRYQHQIKRATCVKSLIDGMKTPLRYWHNGFPAKAFIQVPNGRKIPSNLLKTINVTPIEDCLGAEYQSIEIIRKINV